MSLIPAVSSCCFGCEIIAFYHSVLGVLFMAPMVALSPISLRFNLLSFFAGLVQLTCSMFLLHATTRRDPGGLRTWLVLRALAAALAFTVLVVAFVYHSILGDSRSTVIWLIAVMLSFAAIEFYFWMVVNSFRKELESGGSARSGVIVKEESRKLEAY